MPDSTNYRALRLENVYITYSLYVDGALRLFIHYRFLFTAFRMKSYPNYTRYTVIKNNQHLCNSSGNKSSKYVHILILNFLLIMGQSWNEE